MKKNLLRHGLTLSAGFAAIWLFAACGPASSQNGDGGDGHGIESNSNNELSQAQASGNDSEGEMNIATNGNNTTATTATSTTTTSGGLTATYTAAYTITASPVAITTITTPTFTWVPASAAYKIYVTLAGSTTIKWGLKCPIGVNCINSPVNLGDQSVFSGSATPIGNSPLGTALAAGTYNVVVETASTSGTISQAGWAAFTVQ